VAAGVAKEFDGESLLCGIAISEAAHTKGLVFAPALQNCKWKLPDAVRQLLEA